MPRRAVRARGAAGDRREPPLLEVGSGSGKLSAPQQGRPQRVVGFQEERRVVDLLGQAQEPLPQRPRPLVLGAVVIKPPESPQHRKELGVSPTCWHSSCARA